MSLSPVTINLKSFFLFICCLLPASVLFGQSPAPTTTDTSAFISYPDCFGQIEKRNNVTIFYKPEWFENKKINKSVSYLPLDNALGTIAHMCNLDYRIIDNVAVVFTSKTIASSVPSTGNQFIDRLVGNINEFGKYPKANISGIITDGTSGHPIPGVIVQEEKLKITAITDPNGQYSLVLPVGEHSLKIKFIGYEDLYQSIKLVSDGKADFSLFEKSIHLQEVVVTDQRADYNITRSQMGMFHMDSKTLKLMPSSLGETDVIKSLTTLPGVQSPGEFGTGFLVRGGSADQNLVLLEDVPLFNSSHLFGLSTVINPDVVSSVILYKAGTPAYYGERVSSVMTIRVGAGECKNLRLRGGIGLLNSRLSVETPLFKNKAYLLVGARSSYSNWLLHSIPDIDLKNSSAVFNDLNALFSVNLSRKDKLSVFGYYSNDKFSLNWNTHYQYNNLLGSVRWNHIFSRYLTSMLLVGMSRYNFSISDSDTIKVQGGSTVNFQTLYQTVKWSMNWFPSNKHAVNFGVNGILYTNMPGELKPYNELSTVKPKTLATENGIEMAAFLSDEYTISSKASLEAGLRYVNYQARGPADVFVYASGVPKSTASIVDTLHYTNNDKIYQSSGVEPRLSLRYSINEVSSVKASYNRMSQFINLISNTSVISPTDAWKLSSTNFQPVTCDQYSAGYFRNFNKNAIEASVEMYYKNLKHVIEYKNGAQVFMNDHLETDLLDAKAYGYGIELYVKKNNGQLTGWISYTYARSMHKTSGSTKEEQINQNRYFSSNYDIPNTLITSMNYQISRRWRCAATFFYNTGRPVTLPELKFRSNGYQLIYYSDRNKYRLPDYHRMDISITLDQNLKLKQLWKGSWTLSIINVYGRKNAYSVYYAQEDPRTWKYSGSYNLYKMYILGVPLPTISYNFMFR
jgi:hypothetical protein